MYGRSSCQRVDLESGISSSAGTTNTPLMVDFKNKTPEYNRLLHEQQERLKELSCINRTTAILKEGKPVEESLQQIVLLLPAAWQYPEYTVARIKYMGKIFESALFRETDWRMDQEFFTIDDEKGIIEIFYTTRV